MSVVARAYRYLRQRLLGIVCILLAVLVLQADQQVARLEHAAPYNRAQRDRNETRIARLEARVRTLEHPTPGSTTTTGTTIPVPVTGRRTTTTPKPGTSTTGSAPNPHPTTTTTTSGPPPCALFIPLTHMCVVAVVPSVTLRL